jgi:hypothetical protein
MATPFTTRNGGTIAALDPYVVHFLSEDGYEDWDLAGSEDELHAIYQELGSPYTVTTYQQEEPVWEDEGYWYRHPSLTVAERNSLLC